MLVPRSHHSDFRAKTAVGIVFVLGVYPCAD